MTGTPVRMRDAFIEEVLSRMKSDNRIFFLSADLGSPVLDSLRAQYPERFINVGIAEQNLINVASGLALEGFKVIAYAIASFISMRCYEQTRINLAMISQFRDINVNLAGVGAGLSYDVSGPSHQALEDLAVMRALPNMRVLSPSDSESAKFAAGVALSQNGPKYIRLDGKPLPVIEEGGKANLDWGFRELRQGADICLLATGFMTHNSLAAAGDLAAEGLETGVIDMFDLTGFASDRLVSAIRRYKTLVTVEEGFAGRGGLDTCVECFLRKNGLKSDLISMALPAKYRFTVGSRDNLLAQVNLDSPGIAARIKTISRH